jgi:hypothetical protein
MTRQVLYQTAETTALRQTEETPHPDNEGMLRQVRALNAVAQEASHDCLTGRTAEAEMQTRKNRPGQ